MKKKCVQLSAILVFEREGSTGKVLKAAAQNSVLEAPLVDPVKPHGLKGHPSSFPLTTLPTATHTLLLPCEPKRLKMWCCSAGMTAKFLFT